MNITLAQYAKFGKKKKNTQRETGRNSKTADSYRKKNSRTISLKLDELHRIQIGNFVISIQTMNICVFVKLQDDVNEAVSSNNDSWNN